MTDLRTILTSAGVYVEPAKDENGPAKAATFPDRGSTNPLKGLDMNANIDTTAAPSAASEQPATRMHRLARELLAAMREYDLAPELIMLFRSADITHPIQYLVCREYHQVIKLTWAYRDAHRAMVRAYEATFGPNESVPLPEKPEHKRYWNAFHACTRAQTNLVEAFDAYDYGTIDGESA